MSGTHPPGAQVFQLSPVPLDDPDKPSYGPQPDTDDYDSEDDKPLKRPKSPTKTRRGKIPKTIFKVNCKGKSKSNVKAPRKTLSPKVTFDENSKAKRSLDKAMSGQ